MRPELLVALTDDADLDAAGFVAGAGTGTGTAMAPDWKYEQPETAKAASRIRERIV
jgi:hypothetical protein